MHHAIRTAKVVFPEPKTGHLPPLQSSALHTRNRLRISSRHHHRVQSACRVNRSAKNACLHRRNKTRQSSLLRIRSGDLYHHSQRCPQNQHRCPRRHSRLHRPSSNARYAGRLVPDQPLRLLWPGHRRPRHLAAVRSYFSVIRSSAFAEAASGQPKRESCPRVTMPTMIRSTARTRMSARGRCSTSIWPRPSAG